MRIKVSDNKELVTKIREQLRENGNYCPCKLVKDEDTQCPCKEFREQPSTGECCCGLYYKVEE